MTPVERLTKSTVRKGGLRYDLVELLVFELQSGSLFTLVKIPEFKDFPLLSFLEG